MEKIIVLDEKFKEVTASLKSYLNDVKYLLDVYDKENPSIDDQIKFIENNSQRIFKDLDALFEDVWLVARNLSTDSYEQHQIYYVDELKALLECDIETNSHIRAKPLGYGGDYITMKYIYDYNEMNYLGDASYSKLINKYTCSIDVACSNIARKEYFKQQILSNLKNNKITKILSVGSGPARELIELIKLDKINQQLEFYCLDFEQMAIDYVRRQLDNLSFDNNCLDIKFVKTNLIDLFKDSDLKEYLRGMDFIYISGVFDYLSQRLCCRIVKDMFKLLNSKGRLVVANMSLENSKHRAYYEMFGEWKMIHRTKEDMKKWTENLAENCEYCFEDVRGCKSYNYLSINKT